jgi:hypothetical protein
MDLFKCFSKTDKMLLSDKCKNLPKQQPIIEIPKIEHPLCIFCDNDTSYNLTVRVKFPISSNRYTGFF